MAGAQRHDQVTVPTSNMMTKAQNAVLSCDKHVYGGNKPIDYNAITLPAVSVMTPPPYYDPEIVLLQDV